MPDLLQIFIVFIVGTATGVVDSTVGGGGLISIPSLMFLGLPPQVAIATDRLGSLGTVITALPKFWKAKKIRWDYAPWFLILCFVGSAIGANLLIEVDTAILEVIISTVLIGLLPFIFLKRKLGTERTPTSPTKKWVGLVLYFILSIYGGFFGAGGGLLAGVILMTFFGFTMLEVIATGQLPWIVLSLTSSFVFMRNGLVNYPFAFVLFIGLAIGGYIGSHIAIHKGDVWVKRLFGILIIVSCIKLLFF